jgi:GNAT superfamily N-acetyltransferase
MLEIRCVPQLPARGGSGDFVQTITLLDGKSVIGTARWHSPADASAGLMQLLDLVVDPKFHRKGFGRRLLDTAIEQSRELHHRRGSSLRRVWIGIEQKTQIVGRAFLTSAGFHHIAAMNGLYRDQELMIYVKSLD